ncbi:MULTISPECIES: conjugative transposon protein TraN [Sphingobacterium]|jgi:conjugative transposon TraN protein|uniref:conjugative transposon protein TraN n=1 Tax=Sphingobacterium TaxID=28453 RepID=UPI0009599A13|nr:MULTISPECIES: conjugative transposon protein TraN [Sphingobacterium]OJY99725.1 MAG: conjugative transposon protein TraN [Sphingobacterium sp. 40-24]
MKKLIFFLSLLLAGLNLIAQQDAGTYRAQLPEITMDSTSSLHIISPEPIRYVDISSHAIAGDLPEENVLRLKWVPDSTGNLSSGADNLGVVTVIGQTFIAQYQLLSATATRGNKLAASYDILPQHIRPLHLPVEISTPELRSHALSLLAMRNPAAVRKAKQYGIRAELNHVYTLGDLVLLDITYHNSTNLAYDIDELRFKIEDKKITKATNVQSVEIRPIWQLYPTGSFKRSYRNIYVLKKATFPASKILSVELSEKQISGRTVTLKIRYRDILEADSF